MSQESDAEYDPVYLSSLREMKWILVAWLVNFSWVVGYCWRAAFRIDAGVPATVLGMPEWVFYGVFVPWMLVTVFTVWFALAKMEDHPLEELGDE